MTKAALGLRTRLLLLVLVAVVPGFGLLIYAAAAQRDLLGREAEGAVQRAASLAAEQQQRSVDAVRGLLAALALNPAVLGRDGPACTRVASALREEFPHYSNIGAADPDGAAFCHTVEVPAAISIADRRYFKQALAVRGFGVGEHQVSRARGVAAINFGFPALDAGGAVRAVVFAGLELSWLQAQLEALPLRDLAAVIVDHDGVVLAGRPAGAFAPGRPVEASLRDAVRAAGGERGETQLIRGADGVSRLWAFRVVTSPDGALAMRVAAGLPTEAVYGPANRVAARTLVGFAVVSALALLMAGLAANVLVLRRLEAVIAAARRLSSGDTSARAGVEPGGGELGELVRAFDEMAGSLEALTRQNRLILDSAGEGIFGIDRERRLTFVNPAACRLLGHRAEEMLGRDSHDLLHRVQADGRPHPRESCPILATLTEGRARQVSDDVFVRSDGNLLPVAYVAAPVLDRGALAGAVVTFRDVGEQRRLESQLRQAQKMEAVGQLAGGIAHDFNNILTAVMTAGRFAERSLPPGHPARADVGEMLAAAERAAGLTRQLLAFGRRQVLETLVLDLGQTVRGIEGMLRRLIGEDIALEIRIEPGDNRVRADPGLLEQVIMNLVVNARDAMPGGGRLGIEVTPVEAGQPSAAGDADLPAGPLVRLGVSDTGIGMDAATVARAFEPFFSTKAPGVGTGLGLSTVYGIVTQSGGAVRLSSAPGRGTSFRIYLPRCDQPLQLAPPRPRPAEPAEAPRGAETVLLVEDDESLRGLAERVLTEAGYRVVATSGPRAAVEAAEGLEGTIHLLVTDVILPDARGPELARQIERRRPGLRVLFMSGYAAGHLDAERLGAPGRAFLAKPFTPGALLVKVREVLDGPAPI